MKPEQEHLRPLLDDVVPDEASGIGPDCTGVLAMVRAERARRIQQRAAWGTVGVLALLAAFFFAQNRPKTDPQPIITAAVRPKLASQSVTPSFKVEVISDDELLALLKQQGTPSALMEWPDGKRTLLIVEQP